MTCIVGVEGDGAAWIGGDSFIGGPSYTDKRAGAKVYARNGWHIGVAGSSRFANLLEHGFEWPPAPERDDVGAIVRVMSDIAKFVGPDDMSFTTENGQRSLQSEVMLAVAGRVYTAGSNLGVHRSRLGYMAIGSGDQYALGALATTKKMPARERVLVALRAAAAHCPTVCGPFRILKAA